MFCTRTSIIRWKTRWINKNEHLVRTRWILRTNSRGITSITNWYGIVQLTIIAIIMGVLVVLLFIIANPLEKIMALDKIEKEDEEELEVQQA